MIAISFVEASHTVIGDLPLLIGFNVKDCDFGTAGNEEAFAEGANELLRVFAGRAREAIDSKVKSGEIAYVRLIGEYADMSARPQAGNTINEANIVCLDEDEVSRNFKGERNSTQCFLIASDSFLFVFENALVSSGHFDFLGNLHY